MARSADRNRERTEHVLVEAVGRVIDEAGVAGLGVNAVAKAAGVDKVLIYRYFGGLDGLVAAFAATADFWPSPAELIGDVEALRAMPLSERATTFYRRYIAALRARPRTLAILASEVAQRSPLHEPLERVREEMGLAVGAALAYDVPPEGDAAAFSTIVTCAVHYLLLRARFIRTFNGLELDRDADWERLIAAIGRFASVVA